MPDAQSTTAVLEKDIERGQAAQRLLEDDTFKDAILRTEALFVERWKASKTPEEREDLHAKFTALAEVLREIRSQMGGGQMAAEEKRQREKREARGRLVTS